MNNKRGQELSVTTIVLIAIGIIVLVLVVLGITIGWENLLKKIGFFQGSDLVAMITACKIAAASNDASAYCQIKSVKIDKTPVDINCKDSRVESSLTTKLTCPVSV